MDITKFIWGTSWSMKGIYLISISSSSIKNNLDTMVVLMVDQKVIRDSGKLFFL